MPYNEKVGRGSLGKSKHTKEGSGGPSYIGAITFDTPINQGEKVWLAAWLKQADNGDKFFSIVVERPSQQQRAASRPSAPMGGRTASDMDDEIPF